MIRKLIITTILLSSFLACLFADDYSVGMTPEQQKQYLNNFLSVSEKIQSTTHGLGSAYKITKNVAIASTSSSTESSVDWDAYCGARLISKSEFFKITGDEKLYLQCKEIEDRVETKHKTGKYLTIGSGVACCAGLGLMLAPAFNDYSDSSMKTMYIGMAVALVSCIPLRIGILNLRYKENPNISTSFAIGIADLYNQGLSAQIKIGW